GSAGCQCKMLGWSASFDGDGLDDDVLDRLVARVRLGAADRLDDLQPVDDLAEDRVAIVEVRRRFERDEELAAVGVRPPVGHRKDARFVVPQLRGHPVGEGVAGSADALPERVAALNHEPVDHAMEDDSIVVRLTDQLVRARVGPVLRALGQAHEVLDGLRRFLVEQPHREHSFGGGELSVHSVRHRYGLLLTVPWPRSSVRCLQEDITQTPRRQRWHASWKNTWGPVTEIRLSRTRGVEFTYAWGNSNAGRRRA